MKKLVWAMFVFFCGCSGWGDEAFYDLENPCLGGVGLVHRQSILVCQDKQEGDSCSDGLWCNGEETCRAGVCVSGQPPCETPCDEVHRHCAAECVFDSDCDDGIWCTGEEWCCTWENSELGCEKYHCYPGQGQCGPKMWAPYAICDTTTDTCRGCYTAEECDDGLYCTGREVCSTTYPWQGVCLHAQELPPCVGDNELCDEEWDRCYEALPECEWDYQCGPERFCDQTGKCQDP